MKKIFCFFAIGLLTTVSFNSCNDWLDINNNPNSPSSIEPTIDARLPWFQHYGLASLACTGARVACIMQQRTATSRTTNEGFCAGWTGTQGFSTTSYQGFFVGGACNFNDLMVRAEKEGAYHYMGAALTVHAAGFFMLADMYGEIPYTEALSEAITPKYDDGKEIFYGCLDELDRAIELFQKTQEPGATPLSKGDSWNGGDTDKWIRLCYGLKARALNNLSKKADLYNPAAILDALSKGPTSNANSIVIEHVDVASDNVGDFLWGDPLKNNGVYNWLGQNTNTRLTKWYVDLLTNFDNQGIEDPRANCLIPWAQVGGTSKQWMRSKGVDQQTDIRMRQGPFPTAYNNGANPIEIKDVDGNVVSTINSKNWYCNTATADRWGDTVYVSLRSGSIPVFGEADDQYRAGDGTILATGTVISRTNSPTLLMTYSEMAFIEAEVKFRGNDKGAAFAAYKKGIIAHIELLNNYLEAEADNPSKLRMAQANIDNFINNAIGSEGDLTLAKIMTQKFIALSWNYQNWNDMRRLDYGLPGGAAPGAYYGWDIPYEYKQDANAQLTIPMGKQYRRFKHCSHEVNYNSVNLRASHPKAYADDLYASPVWWDHPNDNYK